MPENVDWWIRNTGDVNKTLFPLLQSRCQYHTNPKAAIDPLSGYTDMENYDKIANFVEHDYTKSWNQWAPSGMDSPTYNLNFSYTIQRIWFNGVIL